MENLLQSWGMPQMQIYFTMHKISEENFKILTKTELEKIIPQSHPLKEKLISFYTEYQTYLSANEESVNLSLDSTTDHSTLEENDNNVSKENIPDNNQAKSPPCNMNSAPNQANRNNIDVHSEMNIDSDATTQQSTSSQKSKSNAEQTKEFYKKNFDNFKTKNYEQFYSSHQKGLKLYQILNHPWNFTGNLILSKYAQDQNIDYYRDYLSETIVNYKLAETVDSSNPICIGKKGFSQITETIGELFDNQKPGSYYEEGFSFTREKYSKNVSFKKNRKKPSGPLQTHYTKFRDYALNANILPSKASSFDGVVANEDPNELYNSSLLHKNNEEITSDEHESIIDTFKISFIHRRQKIEQYKLSGVQILNRYETFKSSVLGPQLFDQEFSSKCDVINTQFKIKLDVNALKENWFEESKKILNYAYKKEKTDFTFLPIIDETVNTEKSISNEIINAEATNGDKEIIDIPDYCNLKKVVLANRIIQNAEHASNLALLILPQCISHSLKRSRDNKEWLPLRSDVSLCFIQHIQSHERFETTKSETQKKFTLHNVSQQPFMIFCGSLQKLQCCHAVFESCIFDFTTGLNVVDFLFKFITVLDMKYPLACPHLWSYFAMRFFKISKYAKQNVGSTEINKFIDKL